MYTKYIDPTTDFGFKKLFGEEESKPILKHFLFDLLELSAPIVELEFLPTEQRPRSAEERLSIFDLYCQDEMGQRFIVEMQRAQQFYFRDRSLYYSTFPIAQQAERGDWDYQLNAVYCIGILNFTFEDDDQYIRHIGLTDLRTNQLFTEKLKFVYVELPKFNLTLDELQRGSDKWMYFLKHAPELQTVPETLSDDPFPLLFHRAEVAQLSEVEAYYYEGSLKRIRDNYATMQTALMKRTFQIAQALLEQQMPLETVLQITGLTEEEFRLLSAMIRSENRHANH